MTQSGRSPNSGMQASLSRVMSYRYWIIFLAVVMTGCGPGQGPMGRQTVPDARLHVELNFAATHYDVYRRMKSVAAEVGFPSLGPGHAVLDPSYVRANPIPELPGLRQHSYTWHPSHLSTYVDSDDHVEVYWEERGTTTDSFVFIYSQGDLEPFSAREWLFFFRWKDVYMPKAFSEATITIVRNRHPVAFTECDDMESISKKTGIPLPDDVDWCE